MLSRATQLQNGESRVRVVVGIMSYGKEMAKEQQKKYQIKLCMVANPEYLTVVRVAVVNVAKEAGFEDKSANDIALAVVEAITNVIRHGYGGPCSKEIILTLSFVPTKAEKESLEILIRDFGKQIDPAEIKGRNLNNVKPGGLGVHIIRTVMDEVEYSHAPQKGMQLRMVKYMHRARV